MANKELCNVGNKDILCCLISLDFAKGFGQAGMVDDKTLVFRI